jgi:hypothetical protein
LIHLIQTLAKNRKTGKLLRNGKFSRNHRTGSPSPISREITIPLDREIESLNVSVAAGILLSRLSS